MPVFEVEGSELVRGKIGFGPSDGSAAFDDVKVLPEVSLSAAPSEIRTKRLSIEGLVIE